MMAASAPYFSIHSRALVTSSGPRTKESPTYSTPCERPKDMSSWSFSPKAGAETETPGRFMPLCDRIVPPMTTRQRTVCLLNSSTASSSEPSSIRMRSPGFISAGKWRYVTGIAPSHASALMVRVIV